MWFQSRRKIRHLERRLARQETQIQQLLQAVQHNHQPAGASMPDLIQALASNQVSQIDATGNFIKLIHEIAVDRMGAAMGRRSAGQRGGKARAARAIRDERGRMRGSRERSGCVLCDDPMTANFNTKQWEEHQNHKGGGGYVRESQHDIEPTYDRNDETHTHADGTIHPGPAHDQPQYPLPAVSIGHDHGGASSDSPSTETPANGAVVQ